MSAACISPDLWRITLAEIIALPQPRHSTMTQSGAILLGSGQTADVWGLGEYAIKLFRHRNGASTLKSMMVEVETYKQLGFTKRSGILPRLFSYGFTDLPSVALNPCGWAVYSRIPGVRALFKPNQSSCFRSKVVLDPSSRCANLEARERTFIMWAIAELEARLRFYKIRKDDLYGQKDWFNISYGSVARLRTALFYCKT